MTSDPRERERQLLTESDVQRVLARAAELDKTRGSLISVAQLESIAQEVGISRLSLEQALTEIQTVTPQPTRLDARPHDSLFGFVRQWWRRGRSSLMGVLLGVVGGTLGSFGRPAALVAVVALSIGLILYHRRNWDSTAFQIENIGLWGWFTFVAHISMANFRAGSFMVLGLCWLVTAIFGAYVTRYELRRVTDQSA
jgi:hypothetical protein